MQQIPQQQPHLGQNNPFFPNNPSLASSQGENPKRKRVQVPSACQQCKRAHAACSNTRPCDRCVRINQSEACISGYLPPPRSAGKQQQQDARTVYVEDNPMVSGSLMSSPPPPAVFNINMTPSTPPPPLTPQTQVPFNEHDVSRFLFEDTPDQDFLINEFAGNFEMEGSGGTPESPYVVSPATPSSSHSSPQCTHQCQTPQQPQQTYQSPQQPFTPQPQTFQPSPQLTPQTQHAHAQPTQPQHAHAQQPTQTHVQQVAQGQFNVLINPAITLPPRTVGPSAASVAASIAQAQAQTQSQTQTQTQAQAQEPKQKDTPMIDVATNPNVVTGSCTGPSAQIISTTCSGQESVKSPHCPPQHAAPLAPSQHAAPLQHAAAPQHAAPPQHAAQPAYEQLAHDTQRISLQRYPITPGESTMDVMVRELVEQNKRMENMMLSMNTEMKNMKQELSSIKQSGNSGSALMTKKSEGNLAPATAVWKVDDGILLEHNEKFVQLLDFMEVPKGYCMQHFFGGPCSKAASARMQHHLDNIKNSQPVTDYAVIERKRVTGDVIRLMIVVNVVPTAVPVFITTMYEL